MDITLLIFAVFGVAMAAVLVFGTLLRLIYKRTKKSNQEKDELIATIGRSLALTSDLHGLLERAATEFARAFDAKQAFFFLHRPEGGRHVSAGTKGHSQLPVHDQETIEKYVSRDEFVVLLARNLSKESPLYRLLVSHRIAVVAPLVLNDRAIGYLYLGDSAKGIYTDQDASMLKVLSSELVIAVQNALSLHEIKELNATLQQRIDVATKELRSSNAKLKHLDSIKDEFMSMASHQLRTPLTSVKGYLSMVLDGDAGDITPQQHKLLAEAFNSSERMVRLIADFLNVSRLQTGKFIIDQTDFDLKTVVRQEASNLKLLADGHGLKLDFKATDEDFMMHADEPKLRQVVMNFIDNAIYYSRTKSKITIRLKREGDLIEFTVADAGIGVPEEEQAQLFNKFFRATNARKQRPDGTGVGLYLARKIIHDQGGSIIFHSKEGKGSTFGFQMPIGKITK